jgi:hypothetical protein
MLPKQQVLLLARVVPQHSAPQREHGPSSRRGAPTEDSVSDTAHKACTAAAAPPPPPASQPAPHLLVAGGPRVGHGGVELVDRLQHEVRGLRGTDVARLAHLWQLAGGVVVRCGGKCRGWERVSGPEQGQAPAWGRQQPQCAQYSAECTAVTVSATADHGALASAKLGALAGWTLSPHEPRPRHEANTRPADAHSAARHADHSGTKQQSPSRSRHPPHAASSAASHLQHAQPWPSPWPHP